VAVFGGAEDPVLEAVNQACRLQDGEGLAHVALDDGPVPAAGLGLHLGGGEAHEIRNRLQDGANGGPERLAGEL
jgi:hypothetical protein